MHPLPKLTHKKITSERVIYVIISVGFFEMLSMKQFLKLPRYCSLYRSLRPPEKTQRLLQVLFYLNKLSSTHHLSFWSKVDNVPVSVKHEIVFPGNVSPGREVPRHVSLPPYAESGFVDPAPLEIDLKDKNQQQEIKKACALAKLILNETGNQIGVGITTDEIDHYTHNLCIQHNCYPSPLNYRGFPKSVCTSVNNVAVHGIPDNRPLKDGDIISIDISVYYNGYHGDCAATYAVGNVDVRGLDLMKAAQECLLSAISICRPGQAFSEIGLVISKTAQDFKFTVVPAFCGHGIGTYFHGLPDILHYENNYPGIMKEGMVFTIEPVITEGKPDIVILEDGWTAVTLDNTRTAQYEHTILVTSTGHEILTC